MGIGRTGVGIASCGSTQKEVTGGSVMENKKQDKTRKLEQRLEPFASEKERLEALERFRNWVEKLKEWKSTQGLSVHISERDLN